MLTATYWAEGLKGETELLWHLSLRDELALGVAIAAKEVAVAAASLRHLPAVLSAALWARKAGPLKGGDITTRGVIADHLGERLPFGVFRVEAAGEVPAETTETLLHGVVLRALLFARSTAILPRTNARRLLGHERFEGRPELSEHLTPIGTSFSDRVKLLLHSGGEAEVNEGGEVRRQ